MKKFLTAAALTAAAIGLPLASAGTAMADDGGSHGADTQRLITVGEDSCLLPWLWEQGVLTSTQEYKACDGKQHHVTPGALAGVVDNVCAAPWHWPTTILEGDMDPLLGVGPETHTTYSACNNGEGIPASRGW
jgi:hypothetical protein